ncbi:hypothetical protein A6V36_12225 [Paraburkholderia ginsengiterrae]|uniref:Uncharacterized protein n=1 Tax=Paraburkholderia ginsengiterrae TaxID=1462993 RepID=A0A1A9N2Z3_9BURK|nr:hypothetical protein A6V36_12225 [Paraburkholderia ginsengiterrae]OAJ55818.1 hypothetical protein A6V37_06290 [Paraburkholderia ginsengiterrae]
MDEFCGKIKAGKDSPSDEHFSIVARVEALIAGWCMDDALRGARHTQVARRAHTGSLSGGPSGRCGSSVW